MYVNIILFGIIFGIFSIPISFLKKPRFYWGSAWFDPISFLWMISFFLYGPLAALISSIIGACSISLFSKEPTPFLGAVLKFFGTLTVWLTFYTILIVSRDMLCSALYFKELSIFVPSIILASVVRCIVEIPACLFAIPYFCSVYENNFVSRQMMIIKFGGLYKYFLIMIGLNFWLTLLDTIIPWILLYPTGIYEKFAIW